MFALLGGGGCLGHFQPAAASFEGISQPVMLGSVDRIGGGAPLPTTKTGDFEGESTAIYSRSTSTTGNIETTTTRDMTNNLQITLDAQKALQNAGPDGGIRVTTLRPWSKGFIVIVKSTVVVEGDVVKVGGGK
jgi:hypothetical protein